MDGAYCTGGGWASSLCIMHIRRGFPPPGGVVNQNANTIQNAITLDWALPIGQLTTAIALLCSHLLHWIACISDASQNITLVSKASHLGEQNDQKSIGNWITSKKGCRVWKLEKSFVTLSLTVEYFVIGADYGCQGKYQRMRWHEKHLGQPLVP